MHNPILKAIHQAISPVLDSLANPLHPPTPAAPPNATFCHQSPPQNNPIDKTNPTHRPSRGPRALSPRQLYAARLLLSGRTATAVAKILGVSKYTLLRWKNHNPRFQAEIARLLTPPPSPNATKRQQMPPQSPVFAKRTHQPAPFP